MPAPRVEPVFHTLVHRRAALMSAARRCGRPQPKQLKNKAKTPIFMLKLITYATRPHDVERKQLRF
jgi:hypothetical protein